jgi:hypothetical protein
LICFKQFFSSKNSKLFIIIVLYHHRFLRVCHWTHIVSQAAAAAAAAAALGMIIKVAKALWLSSSTTIGNDY